MRQIVVPAALVVALAGCGGGGGSTGPSSPPPTAPAAVDQPVRVFSFDTHEQLAAFTMENLSSASDSTLTLADLEARGIPAGTFDARALIARGPVVGDRVGDYVADTIDGVLRFRPTSTELYVYVGPTQIDYVTLREGAAMYSGQLDMPRYHTVRIMEAGEELLVPAPYGTLEAVDGPEDVLLHGVDSFNQVMNVGGVVYSSSSVTTGAADVRIGWVEFADRIVDGQPVGFGGLSVGPDWVVNRWWPPGGNPAEQRRVDLVTALEEHVENLGFDDSSDNDTSNNLYDRDAGINRTGELFLRYTALAARP